MRKPVRIVRLNVDGVRVNRVFAPAETAHGAKGRIRHPSFLLVRRPRGSHSFTWIWPNRVETDERGRGTCDVRLGIPGTLRVPISAEHRRSSRGLPANDKPRL